MMLIFPFNRLDQIAITEVNFGLSFRHAVEIKLWCFDC
ncbi:unnamed protein product [Rhodiola kirilowii]